VVVPGVGHAVLAADPSRCGLRALVALSTARPVATACTRVPTHVPAAAIPPASLDDVTPVHGLPDATGRTLAAVRLTLDDLAFAAAVSDEGGGLRGGSYRPSGRHVRLRALEAVSGVRLTGRLARLRVTGPVSGTLRVAGGRLRGRLGGRIVSLNLRGSAAARLASATAARHRPT
jgi:hypothetical protein